MLMQIHASIERDKVMTFKVSSRQWVRFKKVRCGLQWCVLTCRRLHQQLLPLQSHLKGQLALKQLKRRQFRRGCGWDRIGHDKKPWLKDIWRKNNGTHENVSKYKFRCATGAEGTGTGPFGAAGGSSILVNVSLLEGNNWEIATFSNIQQH